MTGPRAWVATAADRAEVAALRTRVFVEEQGVPPEVERDGRAVIGRMAVDAAARGGGYGAAVLDVLHRQAVLRGLTEVELHAQVTARGFYERAGYTAVGGEYEEAGIVHVTMRRALGP